MKVIWRNMDWYRRGLLIVVLFMALGFTLALPMNLMRNGIIYRGEFLTTKRAGEDTVYTGKVDGTPAQFTVTADGILTYTWGDYTYGPYRVANDPSAAHEGWLTGLRLIRDGEEIFRGGVHEFSEEMFLFDEQGELVLGAGTVMVSTGGNVIIRDKDGNIITQQEMQEPGMATVVQLLLAPRIVHRGSMAYYMLANIIAALDLVLICCPEIMFRASLRGWVRNVEDASPSEAYIAMQYLAWTLLAVISFVAYWISVTQVF